jgi:hypothetical protein
MLENRKVAAYFDPWKLHITRIQPGDKVFLYRSGTGIVATGVAKSRYKKKNYHDSEKLKDKEQEYFVELKNFVKCSHPLTASEIVT